MREVSKTLLKYGGTALVGLKIALRGAVVARASRITHCLVAPWSGANQQGCGFFM